MPSALDKTCTIAARVIEDANHKRTSASDRVTTRFCRSNADVSALDLPAPSHSFLVSASARGVLHLADHNMWACSMLPLFVIYPP